MNTVVGWHGDSAVEHGCWGKGWCLEWRALLQTGNAFLRGTVVEMLCSILYCANTTTEQHACTLECCTQDMSAVACMLVCCM